MRAQAFVFIFIVIFGPIFCSLQFKYHSNKELARLLKMFNNTVKGPLRSNAYSIGNTIDGHELWVAEITAVRENALKIPNIKLIGNIHGNEVVGREILLHFLYYLRDEYDKGNTTIQTLLNTTRIHILPTMNPDGFYRSKMDCSTDNGRLNGKGLIDLNRSFPDLYHTNPIKPQLETNAVIRWMEEIPFILSASLHGGALVANYPYDTLREKSSNFHLKDPPSLTPDNDVFKHLSKTYANNHRKMHLGSYCSVSNSNFTEGITNGAQWYSFVGGMQDYNYFQYGCMEVTLEISCCKYPEATELPIFWKDNKEALLAFCREAHRGIYGRVLDQHSALAIGGAQLEILGRNITFNSFKGTGEFWRILLPGNYTIRVRAEGYYEKLIPFTISTGQLKLDMDIFLTNSSISTTASTIISTGTTNGIRTSPLMSTYLTDSADELDVLCKLPPQRGSRSVECTYPEIGAMLNNAKRSCLFGLVFLIVVIGFLFI